ncbi:hypothetical protein GUJ93_ZPchr0013g37172 [Zizania palustris]|uniref:Uncharacterized protein n=1 Tax=Zizania palustris TaxID=103762 RepID=A0A8J6BWR8_ZIZPA|nr:hypothetical protein GUJ93_ZPchr0013g37172 [Zizania palustris]
MSGQSVANDNLGKKDEDPITTVLNRLIAMETTLTEQGQQQQMLSAGLLHVERGQGAARNPQAGGRRL